MKRLPFRWIFAAVAGAALIATIAFVVTRLLPKKDVVRGDLIVFKRNGGWCWFQDDRAIIDGGKVLIGTVAGASRNGSKRGDIEITTYDLSAKKGTTFKLHPQLESDDHDSPAIVRMKDGRFLAAYTKHAADRVVRWRVSARPGDTSEWDDEKTLDVGANVTYSNLASLSDGRILNFYRARQNNPQIMSSTDAGASFTVAGRLISWSRRSPTFDKEKSTRSSESKPYARYTVSGDAVHFITTEDHPRAYDNGIYHGYVKDGALHDSFGKVIDDNVFDNRAVELTKLTRVFNGDRDNVAWTVDIEVGPDGFPFLAFAVQKDGQGRSSKEDLGGNDHRYHYARFDGQTWTTQEIAYAGSALYEHEVNYTGLVALVQRDPNVLFLSANVDPATGAPIVADPERRRYEIFRGETADSGKTWKWSAITKDSKNDNIRPIVPRWDEKTLVLWLRGKYTSMGTFDLDVVGLFDPGAG